eukprot:jgi/Psemu1/221196/e_gw1.1102.38.1
MRATSRLPLVGKIFSVEWNPSVAAVRSELRPVAAHFVLPDLPDIISDRDRADFSAATDPGHRIHTVAAVEGVDPESKLLLVGGNRRGPTTMSSLDAARILRNEKENVLWGVTNPNDPNSPETLERKVESGMSGFLTQPLLSSGATDTMQSYRECTDAGDTTLLAGLAFPRTVRGLRFWAKLLGQEAELEKDPLFQSHLAYFSQPYVTPIAWVGRELQDLLVNPSIDGVHFMPLTNTDDLCTLFKSLNNAHRSNVGNE